MTFPADLTTLRAAVQKVDRAVHTAGQALENDLAAKADARKQRTAIDDLEDKVMVSTAVAAAAAGTPEQAKAMLAKARAKAMQAAADGADTGMLDAMVRQMERLAKAAEQNQDREKRGGGDASAAVIPALAAINRP